MKTFVIIFAIALGHTLTIAAGGGTTVPPMEPYANPSGGRAVQSADAEKPPDSLAKDDDDAAGDEKSAAVSEKSFSLDNLDAEVGDKPKSSGDKNGNKNEELSRDEKDGDPKEDARAEKEQKYNDPLIYSVPLRVSAAIIPPLYYNRNNKLNNYAIYSNEGPGSWPPFRHHYFDVPVGAWHYDKDDSGPYGFDNYERSDGNGKSSNAATSAGLSENKADYNGPILYSVPLEVNAAMLPSLYYDRFPISMYSRDGAGAWPPFNQPPAMYYAVDEKGDESQNNHRDEDAASSLDASYGRVAKADESNRNHRDEDAADENLKVNTVNKPPGTSEGRAEERLPSPILNRNSERIADKASKAAGKAFYTGRDGQVFIEIGQ